MGLSYRLKANGSGLLRLSGRVALTLCLLAPLQLLAQQDTLAVRITAYGCDAILTVDQLEKFPAHTVAVTNGDGQSASYTGALLMDLIAAACPAVSAMDKRERIGLAVRVEGWDGYRAVVALMETDTTFRAHPVLLAWLRNGTPLDGHDGPLQLIVPDDQRHARNVRKVKQLSIVAP